MSRPLLSYFENILTLRRGPLLISSILFFVVLITTYPIYLERLNSQSANSYFFHKIESPFEPFDVSKDTHASKAAFRLTIPLIARTLDFGIARDARRIVFLYVIQSLLLIPFFFVLIKIAKEHLTNSQTLLFVAGWSSVYVSTAFFWDVDFWFDGFAYFFLLLGMYFRGRLAVFCVLTLACWTDERAVIALSSIYFFLLLRERNYALSNFKQMIDKDFFTNRSFIPIATGACYLVLRTFLATNFSLHTPYGEGTGVNINLIPEQLGNNPSGIFLTFEGLWLFVLMAIFAGYHSRASFISNGLIVLVVIHIAVAYSVLDITRSLTYAFPIIITSTIITSKNSRSYSSSRTPFISAALLCFFIPTQFLIGCPLQIPWLISSLDKLKPVMQMVQNYLNDYPL